MHKELTGKPFVPCCSIRLVLKYHNATPPLGHLSNKNLLLVWFATLETKVAGHGVDQLLLKHVYNSGIPCTERILVWLAGPFTEIQKLSMSRPPFVLLFASHIFDIFAKLSNPKSNHQLALSDRARANIRPCPSHHSMFLQQVDALLYWYPSDETDTKWDFNYVPKPIALATVGTYRGAGLYTSMP